VFATNFLLAEASETAIGAVCRLLKPDLRAGWVIRRDDGITVNDTCMAFLQGDPVFGLASLRTLHVMIDLPNNKWSA